MILRIDYEVFRHTRIKSLFDPHSYQVFPENSVDRSENPELIVFPMVTRIMSMRAYVEELTNSKLKKRFADLTDEEFWILFWETFDDGGEILCGFERFENNHALKMITEWCDENSIPYYIDKKDKQLKFILGE